MSAFRGKSIFLWQLDACGGLDKAVATLQGRVDTVIVKAHDGSTYWNQFSSTLVDAFHKAGIKVGAWGYCYGNYPAAEADCVARAFKEGADFYVADVEREFEVANGAQKAATLMQAIRTLEPKAEIGFTSFGISQYHKVPYTVFAEACSFTMPQVYWGDFQLPWQKALEQSLAGYASLLDGTNCAIIPLGQAFGNVSAVDIMQFGNASMAKCGGVSFWDVQHATLPMLTAIRAIVNPNEKGVPNVLKQGDQGPAVVLLQGDLNIALPSAKPLAIDGDFGPMTESAVRAFQQINHINENGTVGTQTALKLFQIAEQKARGNTDRDSRALSLLNQAIQVLRS